MGKKILILDDDPDILEIVSYLLVSNGYKITALASGHQVFETIRDFQPDLVLMDVMLAKMDGCKICAEIKTTAETRNIPVILISGTHNLADSLHQPGAPDDFVAKPFDIYHLLLKVEDALNKRQD